MPGEIVHLHPPATSDHNARHWLRVVFLPEERGGHRPGWYVERVCPCCFGELVTLPLSSESHTQSALFWLIECARRWPSIDRAGTR